MAEGLRSSGKIWVVVAVLLIIFAGIMAFMVYLERKVRKLEQEQDK
jgi:Na+/alanine symporter